MVLEHTFLQHPGTINTQEHIMRINKDTLQGQWKQLAGRVKETWGNLTDDEITRIEGNEERLSGLVQERYGITKDEAKKQVQHFLDKHGSGSH